MQPAAGVMRLILHVIELMLHVTRLVLHVIELMHHVTRLVLHVMRLEFHVIELEPHVIELMLHVTRLVLHVIELEPHVIELVLHVMRLELHVMRLVLHVMRLMLHVIELELLKYGQERLVMLKSFSPPLERRGGVAGETSSCLDDNASESEVVGGTRLGDHKPGSRKKVEGSLRSTDPKDFENP